MQGELTRALTVVISPLQSLMKDQVENLVSKGISRAVTINGLLSPIERSRALEAVISGEATLCTLPRVASLPLDIGRSAAASCGALCDR